MKLFWEFARGRYQTIVMVCAVVSFWGVPGFALDCPKGFKAEAMPPSSNPPGLMTEPIVLLNCVGATQRIRAVHLPMVASDAEFLKLMKGFVDYDNAFISDLSRSLPRNAESRSANGMMAAMAKENVGGLLAFALPTGVVRFEWEVLGLNKKDYAWRNRFVERMVTELRENPPPVPPPTPAMRDLRAASCLPGYRVPPDYHPDWAILDAVIAPGLKMKEFCSVETSGEWANLYYSGVEVFEPETWAEVLADAEEDGPAKPAIMPLVPAAKSTFITANRRSVFHTDLDDEHLSLLFTRRIKDGGVLGGFMTDNHGVEQMQSLIVHWNKLYPEWVEPTAKPVGVEASVPQEIDPDQEPSGLSWLWFVAGAIALAFVIAGVAFSNKRARQSKIDF